MKLVKSLIYFLLPIIVLNVVLVDCQGEETEELEEMESPNHFGRFVRYAKHRESDESQNTHEISHDTSRKAVKETMKDCGKEKDGNALLKRFDMFQSFLRQNQHRENSEKLRGAEKVVEKYDDDDSEEPDDVEGDEIVEEDESDFDGRDETDEDNLKVARSVDSPFFTSSMQESNQPCENCDKKNKDAEDRMLEFQDTPAGNSKKTSNIALKAAQEAKAAEDAQDVAGKEASKQAKFQLAEKAIQAAKAAQAAMSAKQSIVDELERELRESETVVQDLSSSITQSEANTNAAMRAAQQAAAQLKMLTEAVQTANSNLANSEQAAQGAQQELSEKTQLLEAAKNRVEGLLRELKAARTDYSNTKQAAYKAAVAAKQAKSNAVRVRRQQEDNDELMQKIADYVKSRYQ